MKLLRNCTTEFCEKCQDCPWGFSDLYHTMVKISYPKDTVLDVIQVLDTNHSLSDLQAKFPALTKIPALKEMCSDIEGMAPWK